jgi:hypothetical protein
LPGNNAVAILLQTSIVALAPASLTFPSTGVETSSAAQTVTITNTGTASITFINPKALTPISVTTGSTVTSQANETATAANGNAYQLNCGNTVGCNWPYNYDACWGTGEGNNIACDGYLTQDMNGCVILDVPTISNNYPPYNHYNLQNLPQSHPPIGSWVVVKGQLFQGPNSGPNGACPSTYINVTTIQAANPPPSAQAISKSPLTFFS